ncbi:MAG: hypothetical protein WA775_07915 [Psychroserpens sp.]|uniref:hypothetical protein n=1 Tax=Psychroserpens sp. TaxID=2020870 RepID=UPI003C76C9BC
MESDKFDNTIKDKLEKRRFQPSSTAWSQLSAQLDIEAKNKKRSVFLYVGIAASIIGVLLVTTLFFKSSEEHMIAPKVVKTIKKDSDEIKNTVNSYASEVEVATANSEQLQGQDQLKDPELQNDSSIRNEQQVATLSEEKNSGNTLNGIATKPSEDIKNNNHGVSELTFEDVKAIEVVQQIKRLEQQKGQVTDAEIENLLKQAEREILRDRLYNETTRTVDADALLQDVEDELEQSFRTKVFEVLKSGYKTVKTAVADRKN